MSSAVFLQVRMDSSRLPGKALKMLEGKTVIEHAMRALKMVPADHHVLVTARGDEGYFSEIAKKTGFGLYAGSRQDVLRRFINAGEIYKPDIIIRATGDNPLVAFEPASLLLKEMCLHPEWDYTAMKNLPYGSGVEVFRFKHLLKVADISDDPYDHEHVTPYIYNNPEKHVLKYLDAPENMRDDSRVTLDTLEDFHNLTRIFKSLYRNSPIQITELVKYLKSDDKTR